MAGAVGKPLEPGTAARIFTGAPIPPGADAVVMQEHCTVEGDQVDDQQDAGSRASGSAASASDIAQGRRDPAAPASASLPQDTGLAASVGIAHAAGLPAGCAWASSSPATSW